MRYACTRTSKDLNFLPSFSIETKYWRKPKSWHTNVNKEFLPKNSSQKNPPKNPPTKILPQKSSQKISAKKLLQQKFFRKILQKNSPQNFQNIPKKFPNNFSKNSKEFEKIQFPILHLEFSQNFCKSVLLFICISIFLWNLQFSLLQKHSFRK